jgi:hypothetical protein
LHIATDPGEILARGTGSRRGMHTGLIAPHTVDRAPPELNAIVLL